MASSASDSSLHTAAASGNIELVGKALEEGTPMDQKDQNGATALHLATSAGHHAVMRYLIITGANVAETDNDGDTLLHRAARIIDLSVLQDMLAVCGDATLETRNAYGFTPLYLAVRAAHWHNKQDGQAVVKFLLNHGADPLAESYAGLTPAQEAMDSGQDNLVKLLDSFKGPHVVTASPYVEIATRLEDDLWKRISGAVARAMWAREKSFGSIKAYMTLANDIVEALTSAKPNNQPKTPAEKGRHLLGEDLYDNLVILVQSHVRDISAACKNQPEADVTVFYLREWERYTRASISIKRPFHYLSRHWIKRECDEGKLKYDIAEMMVVVWKLIVVDTDPRLVKALEKSLIQGEKDALTEPLKALYMRQTDTPEDLSPQLGLLPYELQQTSQWRARSSALKHESQDNFIIEILSMADTDTQGMQHILDAETLEALRAEMINILVTENLGLVKAFKFPLKAESGTFVEGLLRFFKKLPNGKDLMKELLASNGADRNGVVALIPKLKDEYMQGVVAHNKILFETGQVRNYVKNADPRLLAPEFFKTLQKTYEDDKKIPELAKEAAKVCEEYRVDELGKLCAEIAERKKKVQTPASQPANTSAAPANAGDA